MGFKAHLQSSTLQRMATHAHAVPHLRIQLTAAWRIAILAGGDAQPPPLNGRCTQPAGLASRVVWDALLSAAPVSMLLDECMCPNPGALLPAHDEAVWVGGAQALVHHDAQAARRVCPYHMSENQKLYCYRRC